MTLNKIEKFQTTAEAQSFAGAVVVRKAGAELFWTESVATPRPSKAPAIA